MRIGVISDSHWRLGKPWPAVVGLLRAFGVKAILHAGDLGDMPLLEELEKIAPVYLVAGNCDSAFAAQKFGRKQIVELGGVKIGLIHGDGVSGTTPERAFAAFKDDQVAAVVFGHSHSPLQEVRGGRLLFNPGSCTQPRGRVPYPSFGIFTVNDGELTAKIYEIKG